ncbi:MAG: hypothetical protein EXS05_22225 [Planctomycetaceae bacterium]|nr:hypothetical protein [Planctomycetaceae bacterium]
MAFLRTRGKLQPDDPVRAGEAAAWVPARSVSGLFQPSAAARLRVAPVTSPVVAETSTAGAACGDNAPTEPHVAIETPATAATPAARPRSPPPLPVLRANRDARKRVAMGTAIGGLVALLLLLLIWLLFSVNGGQNDRGRGAGFGDGSGVGSASGSGSDTEGEDGAALGSASTASNRKTVEREPAAADADNRPQPAGKNPPVPEPIPPAAFALKELSSANPEPQPVPRGGGRGAGGSSGDFGSRLTGAGAKTGDVQISLLWNNLNDLDLHVQTPAGEQIYFGARRSRCGGELDVDMNAGGVRSTKPIENIYWPAGAAPHGSYRVFVHHFANRGGRDPTAFRVRVLVDGKTKAYSGKASFGDQPELIHEFTR